MPHKTIANTRQGSLGFFLPRPVGADEFREVCSLWLEQAAPRAGFTMEEISRIFNHGADGLPLCHLSPFRFTTETSWGYMHAVGDDALLLLRRVAELAEKNGRLPAMLAAPRWEDRNVGVVLADDPLTYWVPDLVICRTAEHYARWRSSSPEDRLSHVQDILHRGIQAQHKLLGLKVELPVLDVTMITRERVLPKVRSKQSKAFIRVAGVGFALPATLHGHWAAGALINRGYGTFLPGGAMDELA